MFFTTYKGQNDDGMYVTTSRALRTLIETALKMKRIRDQPCAYWTHAHRAMHTLLAPLWPATDMTLSPRCVQ